MVKRFALMMMVLLLVFPLASAFDTPIKVKTIVGNKVSIFVYPSGSLASVNSYYLETNGNGEVSVVHTSSDNEIDLLVKVTKDGVNIFKEKFTGYEAGAPISIKMDYDEITGEYDEAAVKANETPVVVAPVANTTEEVKETVKTDATNASVTGNVAKEVSGGSGFSKIIFFIIGGVLIVGAVVFLVMRYSTFRFSSGKSGGAADGAPTYFRSNNVGVGKGSGFSMTHASSAPVSSTGGPDVAELENKIKEAERQLNLLKNREKIRIAEKRLEEDRKELDRLRKGD